MLESGPCLMQKFSARGTFEKSIIVGSVVYTVFFMLIVGNFGKRCSR